MLLIDKENVHVVLHDNASNMVRAMKDAGCAAMGVLHTACSWS